MTLPYFKPDPELVARIRLALDRRKAADYRATFSRARRSRVRSDVNKST